jgi:DNA-binding winged helix-turn-helix (wHTH) protein/Tol biopolymer transport system component
MPRASNSLNDAPDGRLRLRFGPCELDVRSGELRRNGTTVRLQPQPLKVLLLLASRPGDVVTREEIQAEVWPAGTFVDFEQSLNFCIRQIRAALRDDANAPRYVETLPRRGYRWVAGPAQPAPSPARGREWPRPLSTPSPPPPVPQEPPVVPGPAPAPSPIPVARRRVPWLVLGLLAVFALLFLLVVRPDRPRVPQASPSFQRITFRRGAVSSARFGPDGQVVYSAAWDGGPRALHVARSDPRDFRTLEIRDATVVGVSASGEVAFLRDGVLARAPLAGGPAKDVLKGVVAADWSADGREFAVARLEANRFRIELPAGHVLAETAAHPSRLRLSPDGRYVALAEHPTLADDRGLVVILDRDGRRVAATPEWASLEGLAWAPGGREVFFTAAEVGADSSLRALSLDGKVRSVLSGMGRLVLHDAAADGRVLLERTTQRSEILYRRAAEAEDRELSWLDYSTVEGISPDGNTILFYESGEGGGPEYTTFLRRTDGTPPLHVSSGRALALSPDGRLVLTVDVRNATALDLTPTGPGETRRIRIPGVVAHEEAGFLGDGERIFVTGRDASGLRATWLTDLEGRNPRALPLPAGRILRHNTFSPDGSRFVASCPGSDTPCLYDSVSGNPAPVRGAREGWMSVGFDERGRLYFCDATARRLPETLLRLDPVTGRSTVLAELGPRDRAGALGVIRVHVAASGEAWTYTVLRRLSDLHIVVGIQ